MKKYLYDVKSIRPCRALCEHGILEKDGEFILCRGRRLHEPDDHCRRFRYDPLKRKPKCAPKLPDFDPDEFKL